MRSFDERYAAEPDSVARARHELGAFTAAAGVPATRVDDVRLAVSEAVTNAVLHGYRGGPGAVRVTATVGEDAVAIAVRDDGVGLAAPAVRPGLGRGLAMIHALVDRVTVAGSPTGGTEVRMGFLLGPEPVLSASA